MLRAPLRPSRWFVSVLVLCLISGTLALQPHARAATDLTLGADAEVADAQGDSVNIREQPSYSGSVITSVPRSWYSRSLSPIASSSAPGQPPQQ